MNCLNLKKKKYIYMYFLDQNFILSILITLILYLNTLFIKYNILTNLKKLFPK